MLGSALEISFEMVAADLRAATEWSAARRIRNDAVVPLRSWMSQTFRAIRPTMAARRSAATVRTLV